MRTPVSHAWRARSPTSCTILASTQILRPASAELTAAIQRGKMIEAIKIYRQVTGAGLREARAAVEAIARGAQP